MRPMTVHPSVLGAIGGTPLIDLQRVRAGRPGRPGRILAKLDHLHPGGSKKDRIALRMIEDAEASGALAPGQPVVELTSGNTGTGLAIVCAVTGHPFVAVMSEGNSLERRQMMTALGAELVLVPQQAGSADGHVSGADLALVEEVAQRVTRERGAFRADQFRLPSAVDAHRETGRELWEQSGGTIDVFCEFAGTGGTFAGVAATLKGHDPAVACYLIEPSDPSHRIQGGGYDMDLPLLDESLVDGRLVVHDDDAIDGARRLARQEGVFAGFSAGACLVAAERLLDTDHGGATVAFVVADSGMKYLSTDLWS